jgi:hypothetical protein
MLLSEIITRICARVGIPDTDLDFARLDDVDVFGYSVTKSMNARSAIESLQYAYYFDAVESDNKIAFVSRGRPVVDFVPQDDLGASSSENGEELVITTTMETELPQKVSVMYPSYAQDYEQNEQHTFRVGGGSVNQVNIELPIVLEDEKGKEVANVNLFTPWESRKQFEFSLSRKHTLLEPTDVIEISDGDFLHRVRITSKDESTGGILQFKAMAESETVYSQTGTGAGTGEGREEQEVAQDPETFAEFLDIPSLRTEDANSSFYLAVSGEPDTSSLKTWKGCGIYKSLDDGVTYSAFTSFEIPTTIGQVSGTLGDFTSGHIFDETNTIDVVVYNGTLSSATELALLNGANVAVIGNEIVQFKNAELIALKTYRLSGFLRGQKGTENEIPNHSADERFIIVNALAWKRPSTTYADLGLARFYKAVTVNGLVTEATPIQFTNTGNALRPYAPVHLGAGRNGDGATIKWIRRNKVQGDWIDNSDIPMTELTERYEVEIWNNNFTELKRTLYSTTQSVLYTDAQQTTDFGSPQSEISIRVYQMNETIGRGFPAQGVV